MEENSLVEYGSRRAIITITAIMCALLEIVDTTIVNVAMNDMKGSLGVTLTDIAWDVTAYAIANVIIVPMTSWLSQQFGHKNYFAASIVIFTISSFLCGQSTTLWEIILFRFIQGLGGGALLVTSQTIITESYPKEKRGIAQAIYGMGVIVGPTLGPPLGGFIIDHWSWPYIFYINIPIGIIATLLTIGFVRSPKYAEKSKLSQVDFLGIILLSAAVGALQYVLEHGQQDDWFDNTTIIVLSIISLFSFILFVWRELVFDHPIVNIRVLKDSNLLIGTILSFVLGFGLYGSTFIIPIYTQSLLGWTATDAGLLLVPSSLMTAFMMPFIAIMLQKGVSPKYLVSAGFLVFFAYSFWFFTIMTPDTGTEHFFWPLIIGGMGLGLLFVPVTTLSLSTLMGKSIGEGAAFTGMFRQLGGSFGIAIITTLVSRWTVQHRANLVPNLDPSNVDVQTRIHALQQSFMQKGFTAQESLNKASQILDVQILKQSTVLTYMDIFLYLGVLFLCCIPFVLIFIKKGAGKVVDVRH
ncbi:DHA2 family efflux MFS transporter permease subunit [Faecalibacter sp. LW9]|uniref:DHA2 family efflux MFS transporter permease subunit n=1 Tax=Faecalibacter sp. LW9 TaxID=3103144 RepID=UPI002AFE76F8|nr:DHA2 family efflux MFS transporter permease subunit [Faecalibacter sp. LW9]